MLGSSPYLVMKSSCTSLSTCIDNNRAPRTCTFSGLNLQAFTILFFLPSRNAVTNKPSHLANHDFITHRLAIGSGTPWAAFTCLRTSPFALWKGKVEVPPSGPSILHSLQSETVDEHYRLQHLITITCTLWWQITRATPQLLVHFCHQQIPA